MQFEHSDLHGAFLVQDNGVERIIFLKDNLPYLYSSVTLTVVPVEIKVTGRKDIFKMGEWIIRVKVFFTENVDFGTVYWSTYGNKNRLKYLIEQLGDFENKEYVDIPI